MSIESVMPSNHPNLCRPLLLLPSIFPSIRDFSNELSVYIRWPKYWSFSFSISLSSEYSGLISLKIDWYDLLAVQNFQESSPAPQFEGISSLAFCLLYGPAVRTYITTGKTIALIIWTFVSWVMSLLFNTLSSFVKASLTRSKHLISRLQSPFAVILEPKKRKSVTISTFSLLFAMAICLNLGVFF